MSLERVAAVVITRDAAAVLPPLLDALAPLPEVVLYDNGSTDETLAVAGRYPNVRVHEGPFLGFGPTKNRAAGLAGRDWILSVDADERPSPELLEEIDALALDDPHVLYEVLRQNFFLGRHVRHSGWGADWLPRLYHRAAHGYDDVEVHERVRPRSDSVRQRLRGTLRHEAVLDVGQFLRKVDRYSTLRAEAARRAPAMPLIFLRAVWAFVRTYVLRFGFLDGWRGLVIAWSNANGVFFKHVKAYARLRAGGD
jgi:glycosyltransferase involved in cell wall biosynthesis